MSRYADIDKAMELAAKTMVNGTQVAYVVMGLANFVENVLNNAEVEVEPIKHGHWIDRTEDADGIYEFCSACQADVDITHYGKSFAYCPYCGATMDEVDNET